MHLSPKLDLHYQEQGKGKPILLLHGFAANLNTWKYLAARLAEHYKVIAVDLKGFGGSPKPLDKAYSAHDQAALITEFILEHDLRDLTLVGHSFGGGVALLTALNLHDRHANRVSSLVLIDSVTYPQPLRAFIRMLRTSILNTLVLRLIPIEQQVRLILKLAYFDDSKISEESVAVYAGPMNTPGSQHALIQTARQMVTKQAEKISSKYQSISTPTLIVWGRHDKIVPLWMGKRLHKAIRNSRLVIIESAGHIPYEEKPEETSSAILRFLGAKTKP